MWKYIDEQVDVLQTILKQEEHTLKLVPEGMLQKKQIIITASGSSLNAAMIVKPMIEKISNAVITIESPFHLRSYSTLLTIPSEDKLLIALSQTGKSIGTLECIQLANAHQIPTISMTAFDDSPIAKEALVHINLLCGEEPVGPKTKGFTATVLSLHLLLMRMVRDHRHDDVVQEYRESIQQIPATIQAAKTWCNEHRDWATANTMSIVGFGINHATAREGSLKVLETMQIPVMNFDMEEFMHGPHRTIVSDSYLILIDTQGAGETLMNHLIAFTKSKTKHYMIISTTKQQDEHTISIQEHPLTSSWLNAVIPYQVMCTYFPEVNGVNSSDPVYGDFATTVGTRIA